MAGNVKLNHAGVAAILKGGECRALVDGVAEEIAANVRAQGHIVGGFKGESGDRALPVAVTSYTTDRAAASVALAHPAGVAVQAKHGALTRAASAAGVSVSGQ